MSIRNWFRRDAAKKETPNPERSYALLYRKISLRLGRVRAQNRELRQELESLYVILPPLEVARSRRRLGRDVSEKVLPPADQAKRVARAAKRGG